MQKFFGLWNLDLTAAVDWDIIFVSYIDLSN